MNKKYAQVLVLTTSLLLIQQPLLASAVQTDSGNVEVEDEQVEAIETVQESSNEESSEIEESAEKTEETTDESGENPVSTNESIVQSDSVILYDAYLNKVIYKKDEKTPIPTANLAQLMTLYIVQEKIEAGELSLTDSVQISQNAWKTKSNPMFLNVGANVPLEELLKGIAIVSANDASVAVAEHVAGSVESFVELMNETAKKLKMNQTIFMSPNGLGDGETKDMSTAHDLSLLAASYVKRFGTTNIHKEKEYVTSKAYSGGREDIPQANKNTLLKRYNAATGLTSGSTEGHYNLIGTATKEGVTMIAIVLSADDEQMRQDDAIALLEKGFNQYNKITLSVKNEKVRSIPVYKAKDIEKTDLYVKDTVKIVLHEKDFGEGKIEEKINIPKHLKGGIKAGEVVGEKIIYLDGEEIAKVELTVKEDIEKAGFFKSIKDSIVLFGKWIQSWFD